MSKASIYRSVEAERPTLILDEVGWVVDIKDDRQGILCGGFERLGCVEICEGEGADITTRRYATYCPKAFGLIGKLTATLMDRSIEIRMQRKLREKVERLRRRDNAEHAALGQKCLRWANNNRERLATITPKEPAGLNDRAFDVWEPLLAIAERVGGEWPNLATDAAIALSGGERASKERNVEVLADIRAEFAARTHPATTTKTLIKALCADEERPWATYANGKPITDRQLAALLQPFEIFSETVHPYETGETRDLKGYKREHFEDAFDRYLTSANDASRQFEGSQASCRPNADEMGISSDFLIRPESNQDGNKKCEKPAGGGQKDARTLKNSKPGDETRSDQQDRDTATGSPATSEAHVADGTCDQCGQPGGSECAYDGVTIRLHSQCQRSWIAAYDASRNRPLAFIGSSL